MAWVGLTSGLKKFDIKDAIYYVVRALIAKALYISENWVIDCLTLGIGIPKDILLESGLIVHII